MALLPDTCARTASSVAVEAARRRTFASEFHLERFRGEHPEVMLEQFMVGGSGAAA